MGFLNRLRGGAAYGPLAGADDTQVPASSPEGLDGLPAGTPREPPANDPILSSAPARGAHALFAFMHRTPNQGTTAAERAFMDLKRGSND